MLGLLLGGLLGGGMRRGGGGGSSMPTYSARAPQAAPMAPEPQEPSGQTRAPRQQEAPAQQPPEQPMVQQASQEVAKAQPVQQQQQPKSPLSGLMDEAKPQPSPPQEGTPEPPSIVNRTPTMTPVAKQQDETLGQVPQLSKPEGLANQLLDSGTNRQRMEFQSGMPDKHFDTGGSDWTPPLGLSYQQPTTVAGSIPPRRYRM
jgi:hypothetical protein